MSQKRSKQQDPQNAAMHMGMGFVYHDKKDRELSERAFAVADTFQFRHVSEETARKASEAYVDALWNKDRLEAECTIDGELDVTALDEADWSPVRDAFEQRAGLVGIDSRYAELSTVAWHRHKTGGDYWTPLKRAQMYELRAALQDPEYPRKLRDGQSGYGPEATRYVLGVELHDTRQFDQALAVMTPYFERIAERHRVHSNEEWNV